MPAQRPSQPTPTFLGLRCCVFRCILQPALLAEWPRSFTYDCGNMSVKRTLSKSQHIKFFCFVLFVCLFVCLFVFLFAFFFFFFLGGGFTARRALVYTRG